ncbi:SpoIIE family protein phosphatase [bacterium]|nr:SpoIIE family protein phosphatase [bacterium]
MIKSIEIFGTTDVGQVRDHNEDNFAICKDLSKKEWAFKRDEVLALSERGALLVVADGMGGTNAGEVASHLAQKAIQELFDELKEVPKTDAEREKILRNFIIQAHTTIVNHQHKNLDTAGMGTTLVIAWIINDSVHVAWSGDSRCYLYQGQKQLYPFTDDHSLVWQMVMEGQMTPEEARVHPESNIITQSLGDERSTPKPSAKTQKLYKGDKVLVCSDGLSGMVSDQGLLQYMERAEPVAEICKELIAAANRGGGTDNITALMLEVKEGDPRPALKEDHGPAKKTAEKPSTTQVLRKKNSNKNIIIIGLLVVIAAVLAFALWPSKTPPPQVLERISGKTLEFEPGKAASSNIVELLLGQNELTIDSAFTLYKGKNVADEKGNFKFKPDTLEPGMLLLKLYPKGNNSYYEAEVKLVPKEEKPKEVEAGPGPSATQPSPETGTPGNVSSNENSNEMPDTPVDNTNAETGTETEKPVDSNTTETGTEEATPKPPLNLISKPGEKGNENNNGGGGNTTENPK